MNDLHFDADGEPAKVPADAEELRVRRFRKPGERGACEVVHGTDGAPLYVPVDATYVEFRKLVDNVPGRYRLDPVDASRRPCAHAVPCYVTLEPTRNAAGAADERDGIVRELLRANVELMRANVEMTKNVTDRLATIMTASAEIMKAADGAGITRREPPPPAPEADDRDDDEQDGEEDDDPANPLAETVAHFLQQAMPLLETYLADRLAARRKADAAAGVAPTATAPAAAAPPPAATAAPIPQPPATPPAGSPTAGAADGNATAPTATSGSSATAASAGATANPPTAAVPVTAGMDVRNAAPDPSPTPEQLQHLIAVKAKLTPQEQRVVMTAIPRMDPAARAHWLGELCSLPVDQAAELVRSMMPPLRTKKEPTS